MSNRGQRNNPADRMQEGYNSTTMLAATGMAVAGADDEVGGTADGGVVVNTVTVLPLAMLMLTPVPPLACVHVATCAFGP